MKQAKEASSFSKFFKYALKKNGIKNENTLTHQRSWKHSDLLSESNKRLGIVNPSTNLEKRLEMKDRDGSSISISFIKNN